MSISKVNNHNTESKDKEEFVNIVAEFSNPYVAEAYDHEGNTHLVCSHCGKDVEIVNEADSPDDYKVTPYCTKHGYINN